MRPPSGFPRYQMAYRPQTVIGEASETIATVALGHPRNPGWRPLAIIRRAGASLSFFVASAQCGEEGKVMAEQALGLSPPTVRSSQTLVIAGASLGTLFEWYDFFLYGALASDIAKRFFAGVDET